MPCGRHEDDLFPALLLGQGGGVRRFVPRVQVRAHIENRLLKRLPSLEPVFQQGTFAVASPDDQRPPFAESHQLGRHHVPIRCIMKLNVERRTRDVAMPTAEHDHRITLRQRVQVLDGIRFFEGSQKVGRQFRAADESDEQGQTAGEQRLPPLFFDQRTDAGDEQHQPDETDRLDQSPHCF